MKECNLKWDPISTKRLKQNVIHTLSSKVDTIIHQTLNGVDHVTLTVDGCIAFPGCYCLVGSGRLSLFSDDFLAAGSSNVGSSNFLTVSCKLRVGNDYKLIGYFPHNSCRNPAARNLAEPAGISTDPIAGMIDLGLSCFAHTLQLSVKDGLQKASHVPKVLAKCQALAKFSHKSTKIADTLDQLNKHMNKSNVTRWNSEYLLIKSILSLGKNDADSITPLMDSPVKFSNNDFIVLEEIVIVLDPFYEIPIKCQAEAAVAASLVVPSVVHLITHLRDIKSEVKFCGPLVQQLQSSLEKRFCGIMKRLNQADAINDENYGDPVYFMAAVLDPAFKFF
ncbi:unnamed protein product [Adineta ricciae]|uniref:Uncharacterized protein n=1 Tax=Adineta ricciae TaxID=249248 RepID=A0A815R6K6_ADIRI|nr:unnamed protein product [Adineta ricciae]